ncbi:MAG: RNA ligase family protein [Promethearchaeota archaeon]|jgi:ATP-dependent RNA circularization protein (DNA/RNA ligase family)
MFRKYEKTYRILVPQIATKGKHYLSKEEVKKLLGGNVTIMEKLDGANVGIIRHKDTFKLQKRGSLVDDSEHYQFQFFKAWCYNNYDKIMQIPRNTILYGELMICKHTVFYNKLPDYFIPFAWYDKRSDRYFSYKEFKELCDKIGFVTAPLLYEGHIDRMSLFDLIPDMSNFGDETAEGLVVWNHKNGMRGKVVRAEFQKFMDQGGHWQHRKVTINKLKDNK